MSGTPFAAHLAALARVTDPDDRAAGRLLGAVVLDWTQLALSPDPRFELDGATLWVSGEPVALPAPWRDALRGLEAALRAHGVGGVRLAGPVDRGAVLAFLKGPRSVSPAASTDELQRWVAGHGGASVHLLPPRPAIARDLRASLLTTARVWSDLAARAEAAADDGRPSEGRAAAIRALVDRGEADPRALAAVLAFAGPRPERRAACLAALSLLVGMRLGLHRGVLADLVGAALDAAALPAGADAGAIARAVERRVADGFGRADARAIVTLWAARGDRPRAAHLFARVVALADEYDALRRGTERVAGDEAITRLQASRRHEPALIDALVAAVGRWPVGSAVLLDTGEVAVVCRAPASPEQVGRPIVRVVVDRAGALVAGGPFVDLSAPDRARSRVVAGVEADRLGVDVARAVLG